MSGGVPAGELLPCPNPWCASHHDGGWPNAEDIWQHPALSPLYRVQCPYCPVKGPTADTEAGAVRAWNTRATPAPPIEGRDADVEREAAFLVALAEHGISPDVQELLVAGDGRGTVAPGTLRKALRAALQALGERG